MFLICLRKIKLPVFLHRQVISSQSHTWANAHSVFYFIQKVLFLFTLFYSVWRQTNVKSSREISKNSSILRSISKDLISKDLSVFELSRKSCLRSVFIMLKATCCRSIIKKQIDHFILLFIRRVVSHTCVKQFYLQTSHQVIFSLKNNLYF